MNIAVDLAGCKALNCSVCNDGISHSYKVDYQVFIAVTL